MTIHPFENPICAYQMPMYPLFEVKSQEILTREQQAKLNRLYQDIKKLWEDKGPQLFLNKFISEGEKTTNKAFYLYQITQLSLSHCELTELPAGIEELVNLEELKLINNKLTDLPLGLAKLHKLCQLHIEGNLLKKVPQVLCQMAVDRIARKEVFSLYFAGNPIHEISKAIQPVVRSMPNCNSHFSEPVP